MRLQKLTQPTVSLIVTVLAVFCVRENFSEEGLRLFRVWATSCAHVPADISRGRESLAKAIRQSEGAIKGAPEFDWDIMIDAGDLSAHQTPPGDRDGQELIRQYRAMKKHRREQVYNVPGNHDAPYYDHGPGSWFRKWGDPLGEFTKHSGVDAQRRPFPVEGNWERYRFQAGNILFLMLADRNDTPTPVGRGHSRERNAGGFPPGAVTRATFDWWKKQVLDNQDKIILTMHHNALRDTTVGSGRGEGTPRYHGSSGGSEGSSYLYYIIENDDPEDFRYTKDAHVFEDFLDAFHKKNGRGAIDFWVGGHTHVKGPDDRFGGKSISETRWGVGFLQVAALTRHHGGTHPLSRLLTFTDGDDRMQAEVYLHEPSYKKHPVGWYAPATKTFPLRHQFKAPPPIQPMPPFPESTLVTDERYVKQRAAPASNSSGASPDLTSRWNSTAGGSLQIEVTLREDAQDKIDNKPKLVSKSPLGDGMSAQFDGSQHVRIGSIDMEDWDALTVCAWVNTTHKKAGMRVLSKDRIGKPGNFMLWFDLKSAWTMQARDDKAKAWSVASWPSEILDDGQWHHLAGVVDPVSKKVLLYFDGEFKAQAPWTAATLDDSEKATLVLGADSGDKRFGHGFQGLLHDAHLYPRALSAEQIKALAQPK